MVKAYKPRLGLKSLSIKFLFKRKFSEEYFLHKLFKLARGKV